MASHATMWLRKTCQIAVVLTLLLGRAEPKGFGLNPEFNTHEACWERCFQTDGTLEAEFRDVYDQIYRAGMEARRLKNLYNVNGTAFLLDSTVSEYHDPTENPGLEREDWAENIYGFQRHLIQAMAFMMSNDDVHNPFFLTQFNERMAWGCDEHQCLDCCEAYYAMEINQYTGQVGPTSHCEGQIEPACRLAKNYMSELSCSEDIRNEMAIAVTNSDFKHYVKQEHHHDHHRKHGDYHYDHHGDHHYDHGKNDDYDYGYLNNLNGYNTDECSQFQHYNSYYYGSHNDKFEYSACRAHFDTRMVLGVHSTENDDIREFESKNAHSFYIHDSRFSQKAAERLSRCMFNRCCYEGITVYTSDASVITCSKTQGKLGENIVPFDDHPLLD